MPQTGLEYYEGLDHAMGTVFRLHAFHPPGGQKRMHELADRFFDSIQADDRRLSIYVEDSAISRVNRAAGGQPVAVDPDTFALLTACKNWCRDTGRLFDITAGALMKRYGFHHGSPLPSVESPPGPDELRALIGCDKLELDPEHLSVRLPLAGMLLDLGGMAKGWCVERQAEILTQAGLHDFVVSAGTSTVLARGAPPGQDSWPMELEGLHGEESAQRLALTDCALSISGNYRNTLNRGGAKVIRHIMNPLTLAPVDEVRQVVVSGPDAAECEALSTALLVQGAKDGVFSLAGRPEIGVSIQRAES